MLLAARGRLPEVSMDFLLVIHSWVRWVIVLVAIVAVVKFAMGMARRSDYDRMSTGLMAGSI